MLLALGDYGGMLGVGSRLISLHFVRLRTRCFGCLGSSRLLFPSWLSPTSDLDENKGS